MRMNKYLGFTLSLIVSALLLLAIFHRQTGAPLPPPWQTHLSDHGNPILFNLEIGKDSLNTAIAGLRDIPSLSLFRDRDNTLRVEAYFEQPRLGAWRGKIFLVLALSEEHKQALYARGARRTALSDHKEKVSLTKADTEQLGNTFIESLTYIPAMRLDESLLEKRFGKPSQIIHETDQIQHWLYPQRGLDITVNQQGNTLMQLVSPAVFDQLTAPLGNQ